MSIEGQGHFFTIYFSGFVCFVLYLAKISGERLQDHWSSGLHLKQKLKNHCLCLKVANHYCFEAPEPAEGCAKINSICNRFQP